MGAYLERKKKIMCLITKFGSFGSHRPQVYTPKVKPENFLQFSTLRFTPRIFFHCRDKNNRGNYDILVRQRFSFLLFQLISY